MKELSIEQKAQRYDDAINAIKELKAKHPTALVIKDWIKENFPELAESEDERIRKALIDGFTVMKESKNCGKTFSNHNIPVTDILAWLEKQGNNINCIYDKELSELLHIVICRYVNDPDISYIERENVSKKIFPYVELLEKRGEQKSADKVEPKFKVGDTVTVKPMSCHGKVFKGEPFKIVDIIEDNYVSDDGKTYSISLQDGWELVQQKLAWSEEDERMYRGLHNLIYSTPYCDSRKELSDWLQSLKDRVQLKDA